MCFAAEIEVDYPVWAADCTVAVVGPTAVDWDIRTEVAVEEEAVVAPIAVDWDSRMEVVVEEAEDTEAELPN
jgi:hypothetical protein